MNYRENTKCKKKGRNKNENEFFFLFFYHNSYRLKKKVVFVAYWRYICLFMVYIIINATTAYGTRKDQLGAKYREFFILSFSFFNI